MFLVFSNQITEDYLSKIAQYDTNTQVKTVQEIYFDYYVINKNVFHLNIDSCIANLSMKPENKWTIYDKLVFDRIYEGLISICLANRLFPVIKTVKGSSICSKLSEKVSEYFQDNLDFIKKECGREQNGILFIFDRKEDPVTPLINQWTYQAMLHELIGIHNNVVTLKGEKEEKYVLSDIESVDKFFATQMNNDYGTVANDVEQAGNRLREDNSKLSKEASIEDLRKLIDTLPEKKKESMAITKHYKLFYELSNYVTNHKLMELSPLEQDIACNNNKKDQFNKISIILQDQKVSPLDKTKLYLLFAFRYEEDSLVQNLKQLMKENNLENWIEYGDLLLEYAGKKKRVLDVLSNKDFLSKSKKMFMNAFGNKNNVFMQHVSYLNDLLEKIIKGRTKDIDVYTVLGDDSYKPQKVILFSFGGITFEECKDLTLLGKTLDVPIIVGGTSILNSKSFLGELLMIKNNRNDIIVDVNPK